MENIKKLVHDGFLLIEKDKHVYIDPFQLKTAEPADVILITHGHYDHCSIEDIKKIAKSETIIVCTPDCISKFNSLKVKQIVPVQPGNKLKVHDVLIEVVPAYNTNKQFHQKAEEWVGYIVTVNGKRIYHAGDTDRIPEMKTFKVDVALLPVSGTYVMTAEEAALACQDIKPNIAIPMHYGSIIGSRADAEKFKSLAEKYCTVMILC
ncbi:MBL fold metallo-hydrolase [Candidatus Woesearchaeota archaeon]|nr:MAG: MBL fold metallo-hydrolase [Candidatus Woesearchaeota archaeon]